MDTKKTKLSFDKFNKLCESFSELYESSNKLCESFKKYDSIDNIREHVTEDNIIRVQTNSLKCSISTDGHTCNRQTTHVVILNNRDNPVNLCWYHCLELCNKIIDSN